MVTQTIDPVRVPVLNLTGEELQEIRDQISAGMLPPNWLQLHADAVDANVFGIDTPKKNGKRQEQGLGAKGHETANHFHALKKAEAMGAELPGTYDKAVAEIWKRDPDRAQKLGLPGRR